MTIFINIPPVFYTNPVPEREKILGLPFIIEN